MTGHLKSPPLEDVVGYEVVPSRGDLSAGPRRSGARSGMVTNTILLCWIYYNQGSV